MMIGIQFCRISKLSPVYFSNKIRLTHVNYFQSGHVDFWPNEGHGQPGCLFNLPMVPGCSHKRVLYLYAISITGTCEYQSYPCNNDRQPDTSSSCSNCPDMGYNADNSNGRGNFCLTTTASSPFC